MTWDEYCASVHAYRRVRAHRHVIKHRQLTNGVLVDRFGVPVHEYEYCDLCEKVPTDIVGFS